MSQVTCQCWSGDSSVENATPLLRFRNVVAQQGPENLVPLPDLDLHRGSVALVTGPNGSGKSTLLMAAAGLVDLHSGRVELAGVPFHQGHAPAPLAQRRMTALVMQEPWLAGNRVRDAVRYGLRLRGIRSRESAEDAERWLRHLDLHHLCDRPCTALSAGERRLVALASVLVLQPDLLLLDETLAGVDQRRVELLLSQVLPTELARGAALVIATHEAELGQRVAALVSRS